MENKTFLHIHEKYFDDLKKSIQQDTKEVIKLLSKGRQKEADDRFSRSFRELWACFEKDDKNGHFKDILNEAELPYRKIFNELNDEKDHGITRPKISGWLTELYIYYFIKTLLQYEELEKNYIVLHSKKVGRYFPDVSIIENNTDKLRSHLEKTKVAVEVKTLINSKKTLNGILEKRRPYYEKSGIGYFLFIGEISNQYSKGLKSEIKPNKRGIIRCLEREDREWIYFPYSSRLSDIVDRILSYL